MASDTHLHRRVSRLENDTESIYELITEMRATQLVHGERLDGIDGRLDGIDRRLDETQATLVEVSTTVSEILRRLPDAS